MCECVSVSVCVYKCVCVCVYVLWSTQSVLGDVSVSTESFDEPYPMAVLISIS